MRQLQEKHAGVIGVWMLWQSQSYRGNMQQGVGVDAHMQVSLGHAAKHCGSNTLFALLCCCVACAVHSVMPPGCAIRQVFCCCMGGLQQLPLATVGAKATEGQQNRASTRLQQHQCICTARLTTCSGQQQGREVAGRWLSGGHTRSGPSVVMPWRPRW